MGRGAEDGQDHGDGEGQLTVCMPGDGPTDVVAEAVVMGEREGLPDRRAPAGPTGGIDFGQWLRDTLRMWPILLAVSGLALRTEDTRHKIKEFESLGPRVSTAQAQPVILEAELSNFSTKLNDIYMPREVLVEILKPMAADIASIKEDVEEIRRNGSTK